MEITGSEMTDFVLCARDSGLPVISKVGELNRPEVARLLEAGVVGIQLPRTESRQDIEALASYMKFPRDTPGSTIIRRSARPCTRSCVYAGSTE